MKVGADPKIVCSGVGKSKRYKENIRIKHSCNNAESFTELERINKTAENLKIKAPVAIRVTKMLILILRIYFYWLRIYKI